MLILAALTIAAALACLAASLLAGALPFYLPLSTLVLGGILLLARRIPKFLRVFVGMMAALHLLMLALVLIAAAGVVPPGLDGYVPSISTPIGSVGLAAVVYGVSFLPVIRTIMRIADQYFESREPSAFQVPLFGPVRGTEGGIGTFMLATLIGINLFQVAISVRLSFFSRDLFNSFETKDASAFWYQLLWVFVPIATVYVIVALTEVYMGAVLRIRWRRVLNDDYVNAWLGDGTHYRLQLGGATDNPDQRIAEDLRKYVDTTYTLSIQLLSQFATLVSFVAILWAISRGFTFPGTDVEIPGMLVWFAIIYAVIGTWITHLIGRPLIPLNFQQERYEADYRFSLARFREYSEQIALLEGEKAEAANFSQRFRDIVGNYMRIVRRTMKLNTFTLAWFQANVVVPYLLTAPYYFAGKITLGQMQQVVGAFGRVDAALTFFISAYTTLADYKAVIDRLTTFESSVARAQGERRAGHLTLSEHDGAELKIGGVTLAVPDGKEIARVDDLSLRPGEATLLTGASGSGKSTLFRALAGIWPFGRGRIGIPRGKTMMVLPQRPYLPIGSLRAAVAYPSLEKGFSDEAIREALRSAKLPHLAERLDDVDNWSQRLSGGEQQRLAIARALLAKPDWLFLDEATAALDEPTEEAIYKIIRESLPETTIVSIGHRSTLGEFHERRVDMRAGEGGLFSPVDVKPAVPAQ